MKHIEDTIAILLKYKKFSIRLLIINLIFFIAIYFVLRIVQYFFTTLNNYMQNVPLTLAVRIATFLLLVFFAFILPVIVYSFCKFYIIETLRTFFQKQTRSFVQQFFWIECEDWHSSYDNFFNF